MQLDLSWNSIGGHEEPDGYDSDGDEQTKFVADLTGVQAIADALKVTTSLTELSIWGNFIGDDGKYAIGAAVGSSTRRLVSDRLDLRADATNLDLSNKGLDPGDAALIAGGLRSFMASVTSVRAAPETSSL